MCRANRLETLEIRGKSGRNNAASRFKTRINALKVINVLKLTRHCVSSEFQCVSFVCISENDFELKGKSHFKIFIRTDTRVHTDHGLIENRIQPFAFGRAHTQRIHNRTQADFQTILTQRKSTVINSL